MASWGGEQGSFLRGACVCPLSSSSLQVPVLPFVSWLLYSVRDSLQELELRETLTYLSTCSRPAFLVCSWLFQA